MQVRDPSEERGYGEGVSTEDVRESALWYIMTGKILLAYFATGLKKKRG